MVMLEGARQEPNAKNGAALSRGKMGIRERRFPSVSQYSQAELGVWYVEVSWKRSSLFGSGWRRRISRRLLSDVSSHTSLHFRSTKHTHLAQSMMARIAALLVCTVVVKICIELYRSVFKCYSQTDD